MLCYFQKNQASCCYTWTESLLHEYYIHCTIINLKYRVHHHNKFFIAIMFLCFVNYSNILPRAAKNKPTNYTQKCLLNCFIVSRALFFNDKSSALLFIFVCISMGHAFFKAMRYAFPGSLQGLLQCFSVVKWQKTLLGKLGSKSVENHSARFFSI